MKCDKLVECYLILKDTFYFCSAPYTLSVISLWSIYLKMSRSWSLNYKIVSNWSFCSSSVYLLTENCMWPAHDQLNKDNIVNERWDAFISLNNKKLTMKLYKNCRNTPILINLYKITIWNFFLLNSWQTQNIKINF